MSTQLLTRAEIGMRPPSGPYTPLSADGITLHYGGPSPWGIKYSTVDEFLAKCDHNRCPSIWRAWQDYHMTPGALGTTPPNHPIDIAYSSGACPHGVRFEGRGRGHRTAAQGTNEGNRRSYAVVYVAGHGDPFTDAAKFAFLDEQDRLGKPILWVHSDWHSTECPGDPVKSWKESGCPQPQIVAPIPPPVPVVPPLIAVSILYELEEDVRLTRTEYPIPVLPKGEGYWDLDGSPGRPLVPAGRCISTEVNGADRGGYQRGEVRQLRQGSHTRVRLFDFEEGAAPTIIVTSITD